MTDAVDRALHDGDGRAGRDGGVDEQVTVGLLAGLRDEDAARPDEPRVGVDGSRHDGVEGVAGGEQDLAADGVGELGKCERDHWFSGRIGGVTRIWAASPAPSSRA